MRRTDMKRVLIPLLAAAAVLLLVGVLFWAAGPGDDDADQASFGSGDTATGSTDSSGSTGGGVPGDEGSATPGDPGMPSDGAPPPDEEPTPSGPLAVRVDSYYQYDARRLALSYTIGVPECYGTIDEPVVEETARTVTVTLTRVPPDDAGDVACIEIALLKSVDIALDAPLGDRRVLDGSFDPPVKVQESTRPPEHTR